MGGQTSSRQGDSLLVPVADVRHGVVGLEREEKKRRERMCLEESKREEKERTCREKSWKESREASRYRVHELFMGGEVKKDDLEEKDLITCSRTILLALTGLY